jgi:hypothetical protein
MDVSEGSWSRRCERSNACCTSALDLAKSQNTTDLDTKNTGSSYSGAKSLVLSFVVGSMATVSALALS